MRRLPVYLLLDTSGSMHGEPIEAVENGVKVLLASLKQDPYALETAYLSVITFDSTAKQLVPLTELTSFQMPKLKASGSTSLGEALSLLANKINTEVTKSTPEVRGDWKPLVFLMTDGEPTDDLQRGINDIKNAKYAMFVACAAGSGANSNVLKQITEIVVELSTADSSAISSFFKWVSSSVSSGSKKIESSGQNICGISELPPPPPEVNIVI